MSIEDPISLNVAGVQQLVGSKMNKVETGAAQSPEGVEGEYEDELSLNLSDDELLKLARQVELKYAPYEGKIKIRQKANQTYYLGTQKEGSQWATTDGMPIGANLLFEAVETFIAAALAKNPEPVVFADNTPEGNKISNDVKTMLQFHADILVLRRKLSSLVRHWSMDFLAVIKHGWDPKIGDITSEVRDVKKFVFDCEGYVDSYGDFVGMLGERITVSASRLVELYPEFADYIAIVVDGKMGTDVVYTQWWNDDYTFSTFKDKVLEKTRNPHYNYPQIQQVIDQDGMPTQTATPGQNHFAQPKKPYTFLSVFSLQTQPHDITGLIEQNIPNQRRVNRRTEQIDLNLSRQNHSDIFSENNFNQEKAKQAASGIAKGHPILVPAGGPIAEAIHRLPAQGMDSSFFNELENSKTDLRSIFGTQGITPDKQDADETARMGILQQQFDSSRIGGGIGDALEQVADNIFNWWTQLYYRYYDISHYAAVMGQMKAVEYITLTQADLIRKLVVSVSPDSMKPHDEITEMNQALELWNAKALDIKTLLTILNFPDPQNTAAQVWLYQTNPALYGQLNFPDIAQLIAALNPPMMNPPQPGQVPPQAGEPPQTLAGGSIEANPSLSQVPLNSPPG